MHATTVARALLGLFFGLALVATALFYFAPPLDHYRSQIEEIVKKEMHLKTLTLGSLSWGWSGYTWVHADAIRFQSEDKSLSVNNGQFAIHISLLDLLAGRMNPDVIKLTLADIDIDLNRFIKSSALILPKKLQLEDSTLHWHYQDLSQRLEHLDVNFNHLERTLNAQLPNTVLNFHWSLQNQAKKLTFSFQDLHWCPEPLRHNLLGDIGGKVELRELVNGQWIMDLQLQTEDAKVPATITSGKGDDGLLFDRLHAEIRLLSEDSLANTHTLKIDSLAWQQGKNTVQLKGEWDDQQLKLRLVNGQLAMAKVWPWLNNLGDDEWQSWLASMQHGTGRDMQGNLELDTPLLQTPTHEDWQRMRYHFQASVHNADIALSTDHNNMLEDVEGTIKLDHHGLWATITDAKMPDQVGNINGTFSIPDWRNIEMEIEGQGDVDIVKLLHWLKVKESADLHWKTAPAHGNFSLRWLPGDSTPKVGNASLQPASPWSIRLNQEALTLSRGQIHWDQFAGLQIKDMQYQHHLGTGRFDLSSTPKDDSDWEITSFSMHGSGKIKALATHYLIPISDAKGTYSVQINWQEGWQGHMLLNGASWSHFFGSDKEKGEDFSLHFSSKAGDTWQLNSSGKSFQANGDIYLDDSFISLYFDPFITPAMNGTIALKVPYSFLPVEISLSARTVRQEVLPTNWQQTPVKQRPWILAADIEQLQWGHATIEKLSLNTHSENLNLQEKNSRTFLAESLQVASLSFRNIDATFQLPQPDVVDVRNMTATMKNGQKLNLSATLDLSDDQKISWRGFAHVQGEFSKMINPFDDAKRFTGGEMNALISGYGTLHDKLPWWHDVEGRLRLRVDNGRILEGGVMTRLLSFASIADLPKFLIFGRKDLIGSGTHYERLQLEANLHNESIEIHQLAMRASALDMAAKGSMNLKDATLELFAVMRPLQNLDALLGAIPLVRDLLGGAAHSLIRKVYHMHGTLDNVQVEEVLPEHAGMASPGLIEALLTLPSRWFGMEKSP
ncbi:MAG: AsmA-like C-terminal domain-containing protein [Mariprofundaceae bacterium]